MHGEAGDQVVFVDGHTHCIGNEHYREQRRQAGENETVDRDYNRGFLQILQLRVSQFTINLRERLLAAHGQNRVAEGHQDSEHAEHSRQTLFRKAVPQEAEGFLAEMEVLGRGEWNRLISGLDQCECRPRQENDHHYGGDLHHSKGLLAGLVDALDVLVPEIDSHD